MRNVRAYAVLAVTAGALLLTGCGGDGEASAHKPARPHASRTATVAPGAGQATDAPAEAGSSPVAKAPTRAPAAEQPVPSGSPFSEKQKGYLAHRVPKGVDPAAILVSGQEVCERVDRTAEADRAAAVEAIRSGQIEGAKAAIDHLCPEHKDLLAAAGR